jgi:replicative DNA helicase
MKFTFECDYSSLVKQRGEKNLGPVLHIQALKDLNIGLSRKLTVIGGFSGCFKTTMALNVVYNNAINLGWNCAFLSLEMDVDDILLRLLIRHSLHRRFIKHPLRINHEIKMQQVNKNELTEEERRFLFEVVEPDFKNNKKHAKIVIIGPEDYVGLSDGNVPFVPDRISLLISKVEQKLSSLPQKIYPILDMLVIDYIQLFARFFPNQNTRDQFQSVAQSVRYLKYLTQIYANNRGISIIVLSQLNRTSFSAIKERLRKQRIDSLDKYKDLYDLTSLSESSEVVNAADIVLTIYTDDKLKEEERAVIQILKNRFGKTLEEGIQVSVAPSFSYFGDFETNRIDTNCPEYYAYMDDYIRKLIRGEFV